MDEDRLTEAQLRALPSVLMASDVRRVLGLSEEGLRSLREALQGTPSDITAFRLGMHYRYLKTQVFRQARLDHLLPESNCASAPNHNRHAH
jgi:hypothetical protein